MLVALKIAKSGYYNGDPANVLNAQVDHVLSVLEYEAFNTDFEKVYIEMNKEGN